MTPGENVTHMQCGDRMIVLRDWTDKKVGGVYSKIDEVVDKMDTKLTRMEYFLMTETAALAAATLAIILSWKIGGL